MNSAFPTMFSSGTNPQKRPSLEPLRLSPIMRYCLGGTVSAGLAIAIAAASPDSVTSEPFNPTLIIAVGSRSGRLSKNMGTIWFLPSISYEINLKNGG